MDVWIVFFARMFLSALIVTLVVRGLFWPLVSKPDRKNQYQLFKPEISKSWGWLLQIVSAVLSFCSFVQWQIEFEHMDGIPGREIACCLVICLGSAVRNRSRSELGRYFTTELGLYRIHDIVKTGPYELLRHPYYTGGVLVCLGGTGFVNNLFGFLFSFSFLIEYMLFRIPEEEEMMYRKFGTQYRNFCSKRFRLIPHMF